MIYFDSLKGFRRKEYLDRLREEIKISSLLYSTIDEAEIALQAIFSYVFDDLRSNRSVRDDELPF